MGKLRKVWMTIMGKDEPNQKVSSFTDSDCDPLEENYLFDFKNYSSGYSGGGGNGNFITLGSAGIDVSGAVSGDSSDDTNPEKPRKIAVKPKAVLCELETVPNPFSMSNLDDKIQVLKDKEKHINQHYAKREVSALIDRLENRKKYMDNRDFYDNYQNTTDEKIDDLLDKYDLLMKTSDIFIPEFPDDAIATMNLYTDKMLELFGKKPIYYVIAEPDKFKKSYEKRDPILLVQSPFGFYWQILGAWDEEMILLSEL